MNFKSLTQERAEFALNKIKEIKEKVKNKKSHQKEDLKDLDKKYATYAKKLPALITTNGLIPALAFLKSKNESKDVYNTINDWLKTKGYIGQQEDSLEKLVKTDFSTLRLATIETLSFANWLKRMAEIEIGGE